MPKTGSRRNASIQDYPAVARRNSRTRFPFRSGVNVTMALALPILKRIISVNRLESGPSGPT
jgi:hypothetical protein